MARVEPGTGRAYIEPDGTGLRITIPAKPQLFGTAFLGLWMIGWAFGEISVGYQLFYGSPESQFPAPGSFAMLGWLAFWTLGGGWCLATLLWNVAGKEIIELNQTTLRRIKQIPIFRRSKEYKVASIANLRLTPVIPSSWYDDRESLPSITFSDCAITFDYGRSTYRLGSDLDEADARYVIGEMRKRVKSLAATRDRASG
jgi:hypothetical protein